jgi:hypothetical protein
VILQVSLGLLGVVLLGTAIAIMTVVVFAELAFMEYLADKFNIRWFM